MSTRHFSHPAHHSKLWVTIMITASFAGMALLAEAGLSMQQTGHFYPAELIMPINGEGENLADVMSVKHIQ
jgi:hypothetical protein